jgi:hypothetical protein
MDRRSQLMALAITLVAAAAVLPAAARAEDGCRANPGLAARDGAHWYYRIDQEAQQKCWFVASTKKTVSKAALHSFLLATDQAEPAPQKLDPGCALAPNGPAPRGRRWSYQFNAATGQKCWHLSHQSTQRIKTAAHPSRPVLLAAAGETATVLPRSIADAQASMQADAPAIVQDANSPRASPREIASSAPGLAEPAIPADLPILTFESRWSNDFKMSVDGEGAPSRSYNPAANQSAATKSGKASFQNAALILAGGPPLIDIVVVFVATLGSVFILLGLLDWSWPFRAQTSPAPKHPSPLKLPELDAEHDPISALRPDRAEMLSFFAPAEAAATDAEVASRFLVETV